MAADTEVTLRIAGDSTQAQKAIKDYGNAVTQTFANSSKQARAALQSQIEKLAEYREALRSSLLAASSPASADAGAIKQTRSDIEALNGAGNRIGTLRLQFKALAEEEQSAMKVAGADQNKVAAQHAAAVVARAAAQEQAFIERSNHALTEFMKRSEALEAKQGKEPKPLSGANERSLTAMPGNAAASRAQDMLGQASIKAIPPLTAQRQAVLALNDALTGTKTSMQSVSGEMEVAVQFQQKFGQAMGTNIAQAIVYGQSVGKAMESALKATLASIAGQAMVRAIFETAVGFADLFVDPPAAAAAFESAAMFAAVGGAAAGIGAAIPGGSRSRGAAGSGAHGAAGSRYSAGGGGGNRSGGSGSGGGSLAPAQAYQAPSGGGNLTVSIMGDEEAGSWLATTLNRAVTQQGVQLTSTGSQRGAPVGH